MDPLEKHKLPIRISVKRAYSKIRQWYQANIDIARQHNNDEEYNRYIALIDALPPASKLSDLEMIAILAEVRFGILEWAYHQSDGEYEMGAYAHAAWPEDDNYLRFDKAQNQLKNSVLYPYLKVIRS